MDKEAKRKKLIKLLYSLTDEKIHKIKQLKNGKKDSDRLDFIWHFLLQSFCTMGNSKGYLGLIKNEANYKQVTFDSLSKLSPEMRGVKLETVLRAAKVRMPKKKAEWLAQNFEIINEMGGLKVAKQKAFECVGTEEKINFLKQFLGIGDKYARNIWMDIYHPDFHNSIAVDIRIKNFSDALGFEFNNYREHEQFYLDIAKEADLQGWELGSVDISSEPNQ